jgi:crossover junction endodeoxyribonuclease RuvC
MPGQGVSSCFSFGRSVGAVEVAIASRIIPITMVTPQAWKKQYGLIGKDKDMARTLCLSLYPESAHLFKRKKDIGRADATLIGAYNV